MAFEHFERGYLLPKGCKDLIDVINLTAEPQSNILFKPASPMPKKSPALKGDLWVSGQTTVKQLASLLGQKTFQIIADAMEFGVFPNLDQPLSFETISQIAGKYGYTAKRVT